MQNLIAKKTLINKFKFLFDSRAKVISAGVVLFLAILAQGDYNIFSMKIPDFNQLDISQGVIYIYKYQPRIGSKFTLVNSDKKKTLFSCNIFGDSNIECIPEDKKKEYQGKNARVWFYSYDGMFLKDNRLLQLEVEGNIIIDYQKQKNFYYESRSKYLYIRTFFLFLSIIFFFIIQFSNK